jgi:arginase
MLVDIIGVPFDLGASRRGSRSGPAALRSAGLKAALSALGHSVRDLGDVAVGEAGADDDDGPPGLRFFDQVRLTCRSVADAVEASLKADAFPLIVGGDHSLAIGALAGAARAKGPGGVIWLDAHADMNTPATSPTGNIHGMSMAAALGEMPEAFGPPDFPIPAVDSGRCVFVGLRDLDPGERNALRARGVSCFTMSDIDRAGMAKVIERAVEIAGKGPGSVHVSLDIDVVDPATAPGTGTPVAGGITYREAHVAMEIIAESRIAHSIEVVEVNPALDDGVATARVAVELMCSVLGKSIL